MSNKDKQFRTPDPHYGVALAKSVQSDLITEEESNLIEIFISEVNALSQITDNRKYRIAHALVSFREYCPPYQSCTLPEIFVAIERYRTGSNHAASTQQILLLIVKRFLLWLCESNYAPTLDAKKSKKSPSSLLASQRQQKTSLQTTKYKPSSMQQKIQETEHFLNSSMTAWDE